VLDNFVGTIRQNDLSAGLGDPVNYAEGVCGGCLELSVGSLSSQTYEGNVHDYNFREFSSGKSRI